MSTVAVAARMPISNSKFAAPTNPRQLGLIMRLLVIAIGRLKQGPERELAERYRERFDDIGRKLGFRGLEICEIGRKPRPRREHPDSRGGGGDFGGDSAKIRRWSRSTSAATTSTAAPLPGISAAGATIRSPILFFQSAARTDFRPNCGAWHS